MKVISYVKKEDIALNEIKPDYFRGEMLPGSMEGVITNKCILKKGSSISPELYSDKAVALFFFNGTGSIKTSDKTFSITERCLYCPNFDKEVYTITADTDLEYLEFIQEFSDDDKKHFEMYHIVLPWFNSFSNWHLYTEGFRDEELRSYAILHQYYLGRMSMGEVVGPAEARLEPHSHPELYQWFYALPGTDSFFFKANDEEITVNEGDWICIPNQVSHIVSPMKTGDHIDYVWFEVVVPGKEMCPYYY